MLYHSTGSYLTLIWFYFTRTVNDNCIVVLRCTCCILCVLWCSRSSNVSCYWCTIQMKCNQRQCAKSDDRADHMHQHTFFFNFQLFSSTHLPACINTLLAPSSELLFELIAFLSYPHIFHQVRRVLRCYFPIFSNSSLY